MLLLPHGACLEKSCLGPTARVTGISCRRGGDRLADQRLGEQGVTDFSVLSSEEIARRIAILRDNIRQITEQATSQSGAADEERNAERLFRQNDELEGLLNEQERRSKK
jgi:uncharacterized small protein (DUF1192 family)